MKKISYLLTPTVDLDIDVHGGMERAALCILEQAVKAGYDARLWVGRLTGTAPKVSSLARIVFKNRIAQYLYYLVFGCINFHSKIFHGHYTPALCLLFPKKSVLHFHGLAITELPLYRFFRKRYEQVDYIFNAEWVRGEFRKKYPLLPIHKLHLIYYGIDSMWTGTRVYRKSNNTCIRVLFIGGWIRKKGVIDFINAIERANEQKPCIEGFMAGSAFSHYQNEESEALDREIRDRCARSGCVRLVGNVKRQDLPGFLEGMDIGVVPSVFREPFGLVSLEMMSSGMPVIAYDIGGLREQIVNNKTGFLVTHGSPVAIADKIVWFVDHQDQIELFGRAAHAHVASTFSWEKHFKALETIYLKKAGKKWK